MIMFTIPEGIPLSKTYWAICEQCRGDGRVDHPAFSNGITSSEWQEWDPDERDVYLRGGYDVNCSDCGGTGKVRAPDVATMSFAEKRLLASARRDDRDRARWAAEDRAIMRMESYYAGEF